MAELTIIKYGNPLLRVKAAPVQQIDEEIHTLAKDMFKTLYQAEGVGLAATQIGRLLSLTVVDLTGVEENSGPITLINPQILSKSGEALQEEGCLSIPEIREEVPRATSIEVEFLDLEGRQRQLYCQGLLARVLQHEIDHLNGILFIDRISPIRRRLISGKLREIAKEEKNRSPMMGNQKV